MADDSESESDEESDEEDEAGHLVVVLPIDKEADGGGGGGGSGAQKPTCLSRCWKRGQFFFHECLPAVVCCSVGIIVMMLGQDATFVDAFYCEFLSCVFFLPAQAVEGAQSRLLHLSSSSSIASITSGDVISVDCDSSIAPTTSGTSSRSSR